MTYYITFKYGEFHFRIFMSEEFLYNPRAHQALDWRDGETSAYGTVRVTLHITPAYLQTPTEDHRLNQIDFFLLFRLKICT